MVVIKDKYLRRLVLLEPCIGGSFFITRLPACSLGDYLWVLSELNERGIKYYER